MLPDGKQITQWEADEAVFGITGIVDYHVHQSAEEYDVTVSSVMPLTRDALFNAVWGADCFTEPGTVSVHIRWLREKIEQDPNSPKLIQTVWKVGYRFGDVT